MPRLKYKNPAYRLHKASGQAIVTLSGQDVYLGPHRSAASRAAYDQAVAEWLARGRQRADVLAEARIADVIKAYWDHAQEYFGGQSHRGELNSIKLALSQLRRLYGSTPARDFGPKALQVVRSRMIELGWSRRYINGQVGRIKRCFKWAASLELIPPTVFHGLQCVAGLRKHKTAARETEPVKPVPDEWVEQTIPHVSRQVAGMIRLQLATGMRPGEVCILRGCDLDMTGPVWTYTPLRHKTQHRGHERIIHLGPCAQGVLKPFLKTDAEAYVFSPAEAEADRRAMVHAARKTPLSCGNRPGTNKVRTPARKAKSHYSVHSYHQAITRACNFAFLPPDELARRKVPSKKKSERWESLTEWRARLGEQKWAALLKWQCAHRWHPHQLRHNVATRLRKVYGLEIARVVLGHSSASATEIYAEIDQSKAREIMELVG